jgi:hypothetical protein
MKKLKITKIATILMIFLLIIGSTKSFAHTRGYYWNWEATNNTVVPCDNFEVVLSGNVADSIFDYFIGSIVHHIPGWTASWHYDAVSGHTIVIFQGGTPIPPGTKVHYGIDYGRLGQRWLAAYWSSGGTYYKFPSMLSHKWYRDVSAHVLNYTLYNLSDEALVLNHLGYIPFNGIQPLDQLNSVTMPVQLFGSTGVPDGIVFYPGDSVTFQIHNISLAGNPDLSVVLYQSTRFLNPPAGTSTGNMDCWSEGIVANAPVISSSIPTLSQWGLIFFGIILLSIGTVFIIRRKNQPYVK